MFGIKKSMQARAAATLLAGTLVCPALRAQTAAPKRTTTAKKHTAAAHTPAAHHAVSARTSARSHTAARHTVMPAATPESRRLNLAFVASAQLRPMAQQLVLSRSAAAYSGVIAYAAGHPGEAAAAANLALGHAYMLDKRYADAETAFRRVDPRSSALADYADYLGAQAAVKDNRPQDALPLLDKFADRHPGSLFVNEAPVLLATAYVAGGDAGSAVRTLEPLQGKEISSHVDFRLALAEAYQGAGRNSDAATLYRGLYLKDPLSPEADTARTRLAAMNAPLSAGERKQHADAMFNARQYGQAATEYRALQKSGADLSQADKDALEIYAAVCDLRLKRLSRSDVERLPVTGDDSAALKMYLQSELAKSAGNTQEQDAFVQQLTTRYPQSRWLEEALYSGGNMYLLKRDAAHAVADFEALTTRFPHSMYAANGHWRAAWMSYRLRRYTDAARLMDEQIVNYPGGDEIPGALYWRGRIYEDEEHNFGQALNYYNALSKGYANSYYAILARQRIAVLGKQAVVPPAPPLASVRVLDDLHLTDALPENDPHLIKARLLANAALNEYIRPEIQLSATSAQWGAFAEAEIYESFGESTRALQAMKRSKIPFFALPVSDVPMAYWQIVFPRPYWQQLMEDAQANGLDPYLVASLIRQESEFNPGAVSRANAVGLMQLLPSVGRSLAKKQGEKHFSANELLDPATNLRLGTADLRQSINRYSGQIEYALAAYNAGDTPVHQWIAMNDYKDIPEWVESIPYTETREYVQSILRNREMYRAVYAGK
jgi:soluble lytic murein transglycosylase